MYACMYIHVLYVCVCRVLMHTNAMHCPDEHYSYAYSYTYTIADLAVLIIIDRQFQAFQRFFSSKLVLKTVESRSDTLSYYEDGSIAHLFTYSIIYTYIYKNMHIYTYIHTYRYITSAVSYICNMHMLGCIMRHTLFIPSYITLISIMTVFFLAQKKLY
jgi:hypothetical protein